MSLYSITADIMKVLDAQEQENAPELDTVLDGLKIDFDVKAENIVKYIRNQEAEATACKLEKLHFADRQKVAENKVTRLKQYLKDSMDALSQSKITAGVFSITLSKPTPKIQVVNEAEILPGFFKATVIKLDKKLLLSTFKETGEVPAGTELIQSKSLRIK